MKYDPAVYDWKKDGGWEEVERGVAEFSQCVFNLEKGKIY